MLTCIQVSLQIWNSARAPRRVHRSVSTTPARAVGWDNPSLSLTVPDKYLWLQLKARCKWTILHSLQPRPDILSKHFEQQFSMLWGNRETVRGPRPISVCKVQIFFLWGKLRAKSSCLSYPNGNKAFLLPCVVMRSGTVHGRSMKLGFGNPISAWASSTHPWRRPKESSCLAIPTHSCIPPLTLCLVSDPSSKEDHTLACLYTSHWLSDISEKDLGPKTTALPWLKDFLFVWASGCKAKCLLWNNVSRMKTLLLAQSPITLGGIMTLFFTSESSPFPGEISDIWWQDAK